MATMTIQPTIFKELSALVTAFIAEKDSSADKARHGDIITANHLLIAIENAANIFKECLPQQSSSLAQKVSDFRKMIACLRKADYCRFNLPGLIRHSIDTGTSNGWIPKLYGVNPQFIVPGATTTVQFFGKFKYADPTINGKTYMPTLKVGDRTFQPVQADHHTLTFNLTFNEGPGPFQSDKCSQFFSRLIVPYEAGKVPVVMRNQKTFEFDVPIRALPINAGIFEFSVRELNDQPSTSQFKMAWKEVRIVHLDSSKSAQFTFTSFDGRKQEFTALGLEAEAKKSLPAMLNEQATYLRISQYEGTHNWRIETIPPDGL
jgi:hypothetical protein